VKQYSRLRDLADRAKVWAKLYDPVLPPIFLKWAEDNEITVPAELAEKVAKLKGKLVDWKKQYEDTNAACDQLRSVYDQLQKMYAQHIADWKGVVEKKSDLIEAAHLRIAELEGELAAVNGAPPAPELAKPQSLIERQNMLKAIFGMAVRGYATGLEAVNEDLSVLSEKETDFLPITTKAYLYLSGTPFRALATGEFIEEQIFNWTYTDEQRAKEEFAAKNTGKWNPYGALPQMRLLTYQMPDELVAIASAGEFDEFDLNAFFEASGTGTKARFKHKSDVQKWLDIIRGQHASKAVESLKTGTRPPFPYSDVRLLPYTARASTSQLERP
jgi:hypothetical protein